jgi:aquaporin Z
MTKKLLAELIGTFWLVLGGCGAAVLAAGVPEVGIGYVGVALAFGLSVLTGAYALGHISGAHFNPAVTLGLTVGGRFPLKDVPFYIAAQVVGGIVAAYVLFLMATGGPAGTNIGAFASNGYGDLSPQGYGLFAALVAEIVLTAMFVFVIMGATSAKAPAALAPLAIGLALTLVHLISIPVTNTSVNPARSTAVALFAGGPWIAQLWLFWVAPLVGGFVGGGLYRILEPAER